MLAGLVLFTGVVDFVANGVFGLERLLSCEVPRSFSKRLVPDFGGLMGDAARGVDGFDLVAGDAVADDVPLSPGHRLNVNLLLRDGEVRGVSSASVRTGDCEGRGFTGEIWSTAGNSSRTAWLGRAVRGRGTRSSSSARALKSLGCSTKELRCISSLRRSNDDSVKGMSNELELSSFVEKRELLVESSRSWDGMGWRNSEYVVPFVSDIPRLTFRFRMDRESTLAVDAPNC